MSVGYAEFLASKRIRFDGSGVDGGVLSEHLFDFQHEVVAWALEKGRACVFADCGLGKTVMQLEWASRLPGRTLLLAPLAVGAQTEEEARHFGYDATYQRERAGSEQITITNYERLDRFEMSSFDGVVLDESSILKSYDGAFRQRVVREAAALKYRLACTATPSPNDFIELGNHAEFVGSMSRAEMLALFFINDGDTSQAWRLKRHARAEFWAWVRSWAVLFTSPADLGYDDSAFRLPPLSFHHVSVESDYRGDALIPGAATLDLMERRRARRSSLEERCTAAADLANGDAEPWILWCDLNDESRRLTQLVPDAVEVTGSDPADEKAAKLLAFAHGDARVIVTKPRIGGFGMNWQHCAKMAFVGLSDSYEALYQATRRCWRFGQKRAVDAYVIASEAERTVVENVLRKEATHREMQREMIALAREAA